MQVDSATVHYLQWNNLGTKLLKFVKFHFLLKLFRKIQIYTIEDLKNQEMQNLSLHTNDYVISCIYGATFAYVSSLCDWEGSFMQYRGSFKSSRQKFKRVVEGETEG